MRKLLFISIVSIFTFISCATVGKYDPTGDYVFWKVDDGDNTVYLLGSIHVGKEENYPLPDTIENAYKNSEQIAVELNVNDIDMSKVLEFAMLGGDTTLKDLVSPETYKMIEKNLAGAMSPLYFNKLRPSYLIFAVIQFEMQKAGFDGSKGIDMYFMNKAETDLKEIKALEKTEDQLMMLQVFDRVSDEYFKYSIEDAQTMIDEVDKMYLAWEKGDLAALNEYVNDADKDFPEVNQLMQEINRKRNIKMTERIKEIIDSDKTTFIIVGSAHLIGEGSIIELLNKTGNYNIDRI